MQVQVQSRGIQRRHPGHGRWESAAELKHAEMSKQNVFLPYLWVNGSSSNALHNSAHAARDLNVCLALIAIACCIEAWNPSIDRWFTFQKLRLGKNHSYC